MFWLRNEKIIFWYALLTKSLSHSKILFVSLFRFDRGGREGGGRFVERVSANDNYGDSRKVVDRFDRREGRDVAPRVGGGRYDDQRRDRASARDDPKFDRYKI